ncbi:E3 SUMO-protein ligase RanBP2 [Episyrphus balteatus]|uniref:E3 SUMO-protein ligase RanBP2 n=1 Tax=Episyrphus balteatus TaxID=286459 RepID=UPI00248597EB|nr:E3 SUMO-protein ligase RanBP2 [Episyrphus balteatus]
MFKSKKEVDVHVRTALSKLRSENEKNLRSFTIAKLYFKINEYSAAEEYVTSYLSIKDDNDQAHKLLGQCYLHQKKTSKALAAFQRSLQLNPKQPDLLGEVCQLLIDDKSLNTNKAKYWCDLAESEKVQHDAVFSLRLKLMNKDNLETNQVEQMIQKEISSRPQDVNLRIRLMRHLVEQNKILEAFQNTYQLEMVNHGMLAQSPEWYNVVWLVLSKYEQIPNGKKDWQFWLLLITCLERQVHLSFVSNKTNLPNGGITETANLLFSFDQYLYKFSQLVDTLNQQKEFVTRFLEHYQGQLCLYAAALIFKRELIQNKYKWKETIKSSLPMLLLAYQSGRPDGKQQWMKHLDEHGTLLLQQWNREGAFRCVQAGRTLVGCIEENNENSNQINNIIGNNSPWTTPEALVSQVRQICTDKNWRRGIFGQLFCNSDQKVKENTSYFIKCAKLSEPIYELPTYAELEQHEETAQYLNPQSLEHMVYLCLGNDNLAHVRAKFFSGLNFSTHNLSFCGAETLNQLDIETFLYATTLQLKSLLSVERLNHDCYHQGIVPKPKIMPFVNIKHQLCTDEQANWWLFAYQVYKNLASDNLAEIRATLQYGIEAVRGINGPKIDMLIVFKLGKIFENRAIDANKPVEKGMLEARAQNLYKYGLNMIKMNNKGVLEPFKRYFKYADVKSSSEEREISKLAEEAVTFLATKYFKKSEYEDLIEELSGIQLPFATYFQSEAYRKLDEAMKTPKKNKRAYLEKASECLNQTLQLLKSTQVDPNHPLNAVIPFELKNLQQSKSKFMNEQSNNSSSYEDAETEFNIGDSTQLHNISNRSRRETSIVSQRTVELENMVKQISNMMTFVKKEIVESIKPEIVDVHTQLKDIKERLSLIEDNMPKKSIPPSRDEDASNVLDDLYIIEDELQNQMYSNQQQQQQTPMNMYGSNYSQQNSMGQRLHTPTAVASGGVVNVPGTGISPYNNPLYGNYAMNYYAQQLMMPPQPPAAPVMGTHPSQLSNRNALGLSYMDSAAMNFNMTGLNPSLIMQPPAPDSRTSNLFGLLNQNSPQQPQLGPSIQQQPPPTLTGPPLPSINIPPKMQPSAPQIPPPTVNVPPPVPITFNKSLNNTPVEKGPPVNVVITSSDPLPTTSVSMQPQPTLSVTIPSHHIKPSLVSTNDPTKPPPNTSFPMTGPVSTVTSTTSITSPFTMKFPTPLTTTTATTITTGSPLTFSFKPPPPNNTDSLNKTNDSNTSDLHKSEHEVEYDPRPDFQPIIPLPDEIEVKTGEENEEVMFSARSKLFRFADKEWKERGVGDLKILKNNENGTSRILMRRDQTHKICANHRITSELNLTKPKSSDKGFIWAANDFADEELKLEKFLVRFKHMETEQQFEAAFKVARNEAIELEKKTNGNLDSKTKPFGFGLPKTFAENKTSTPAQKTSAAPTSTVNNPNTKTSTLPKTLFENISSKKPEETKSQTSSPFANFTFDKTTNAPATTNVEPKPFANLFANINATQTEYPSPINNLNESKAQETKVENLNKSDNEDEYVPTAQFQPVIPLPDLVEVTTGEENEIVLFEHRAKLLRFDKTTSEWKERGLGNIKVLQDKNDVNNVRLVMRREIIHKLCCNQRLYKDTSFKYTKNSKTSLMWAGQDFSENELQVETLTIRFKTAESCKQFLDVITEAQAKMTIAANEENAKNEEPSKTSTAPVAEKGFGDKFKPKTGSWSCEQCYTSNTAEKLYCASCEAPKDDTVPKKNTLGTSIPLTKSTFTFGFGNSGAAAATQSFVATEAVESAKQQTAKTPLVGFGDKFKPKEGSWNCEQCYTSNTADKLYCASCEAPKDKTVPKKEAQSISLAVDGKSEFSFGFGTTTAQKSTTVKAPTQESKPSAPGFGDKFKPKLGSWSCSECYLSNSGDELYCKACDNPKDSTVPKKEPVNILAPSNPSAKFSFGFPAAGNTAPTKTETPAFSFGKSNLGETGVSSGFTFGIPKDGETENKSEKIFGSNFGNTASTNFSSTNVGESKSFSFMPATSISSDSTTSTTTTTGTISKSTFSFTLPSKTIESSAEKGVVGSSFSLDKKDFNFVLKPKSPGKAKSPLKAMNSPGTAADEDDDEVAEEEENNTYFTPVIPLPDKIEVKTGEEDEEVMYSHRAKLYRYTDGEWKERGLGDVKILQHKITKKLRVVMRRELVLKICLNHALNEDVLYKNKDDKSWLFIVNDYSEGEVELNKFCLRFRSTEIADDFMKAVNDCLSGTANAIKETNNQVQESDVSSSSQPSKEVNISDESKRIADKLLLPYSFFDVSSIVTCPGCRGCDPDNFIFPNYAPPSSNSNDPLPLDMTNLTINKPNFSITKPSKFVNELSPPKTETETSDSNSIFGSKLFGFNSVKSDATNFSFTQALNSTAFGGGTTTGSNIFGDKSVFGKPSILGGNATQWNGTGVSLFGNNSTNILSKPTFQNSLFGQQQQPQISGDSSQTDTAVKTTIEDSNSTKTSFGGSSVGGSLFGSKPLFGSSTFGGVQQKPQETAAADSSTKTVFGNTTGSLFSDGGLSFEALAKQATQVKPIAPPSGGFIGLTHTNAFSSFNKSQSDDADHDPHFEPIIPLPDEITVSTGEEDEEKIFGERATLFRYDQDKKEWKERGVGELKILQHKTKGTYRMVMRREQIFKLVLNHAIGADFSFNQMGNNQRAFLWATFNYAEEGTEGSLEKLSCRFRNVDCAKKFNEVLSKCIETVKSRAELEPEED